MANMLPATSGDAASQDCGVIQWGDLVVIHESIHVMKSAYMTKAGRYDSKFGHFKHEDWVGLTFGSKVYSNHGAKGFVFLLAPSPDLWSLVLKHRTQILYMADCSLISYYLELRPGSIVLESGTGSASLTHALARAVAPSGHVHTFEFHEKRSEEARRELGLHGMGSVVSVGHRDIMELGFPKELEDLGTADGVFLDLPGPWKVVASAARCLRPDGRFCSFSPCIEQVQRVCEACEKNGLTDITTVEVLLRVHEVRNERLVKIPPPPQAAASSSHLDGNVAEAGNGTVEAVAGAAAAAAGAESHEPAASIANDDGPSCDAAGGVSAGRAGTGVGESKVGGGGGKKRALDFEEREVLMVTAKPAMDARGHTGYLTFARKFVVPT